MTFGHQANCDGLQKYRQRKDNPQTYTKNPSGLEREAMLQDTNMGMTSRTFHRKLKAEGTSWRNLRNTLIMDLAEELLKQHLSC